MWQLCLPRFSAQESYISKHSSFSDSSQLAFHGCASSSGYDVYVEEACEVVLAASGQEVVAGTNYLDGETDCLQNADLKLLLELSSSQSDKHRVRHSFLFVSLCLLPSCCLLL